MSNTLGGLKKNLLFFLSAIGGLHLVNEYIFTKSHEKGSLTTEAGSFWKWKFGKVFYSVRGEGEKALLLIHDVEDALSGYEWDNVVSSLEKSFTVYIVDLPGTGRSDKPQITYTNYVYCDMIRQFAEDIIKKPCVICASGFSGTFALTMAMASPKLVTSLCLINPPSPGKMAQVPDQKSRAGFYLLRLPVIGTTIYNMYNSRRNLENRLIEKSVYNPFTVTKKLLDHAYDSAHRNNGNGRFLLASLRGLFLNWNLARPLSMIEQPVTIIYGTEAPGERAIAAAYKKAGKTVDIVSVENCGMLPQIEKPELIIPVLERLL